MKKLFRIIYMTALMTAMCVFPSFASTAITSVEFSYTIDPETAITEGCNDPSLEIAYNAPYELEDWSCSSDTGIATGKSPLTYSMTLSADRGYYFSASSSISITGNGTSEIIRSTVSSDKSELTVRFRAYPYYQAKAPSFITAFDDVKGSKSKTETSGRGTTVSINKNGASKVDYVISYVDQSGEYKTKGGTTTSSSISVSSYNRIYSGTSSDRHSAYILGIAIRASENIGSQTKIAPSSWVYISGGSNSIDTEEYFYNYSCWGDVRISDGGSAGSAGSSGNTAGTVKNGWGGSGDTWYYYSSGATVKGWVFDGGNWYYCDPSTGKMASGWINDGGKWYYLNQNHDGTYGCMKTGWIKDGGYWYYLNQNHDGTFGCMLTGWVVTSNGVRYYLIPEAGGPMGAMATGTRIIDGKTYYFNVDGSLMK
ncbi:MAG: hypothetical protein PUC98_04395 [Clostridiales bacterium]|nr:hypothetical protein [Clostridiales bacterium]